jgi:hypothetical protein
MGMRGMGVARSLADALPRLVVLYGLDERVKITYSTPLRAGPLPSFEVSPRPNLNTSGVGRGGGSAFGIGSDLAGFFRIVRYGRQTGNSLPVDFERVVHRFVERRGASDYQAWYVALFHAHKHPRLCPVTIYAKNF